MIWHIFHARTGVVIILLQLTSDAISYAAGIESKIVLINGTELANHQIAPNLGLSVSRSNEVKRIDTDYFGEG